MKLNKILMSTLVGCSLLTPIILSSCSIKNSDVSSNDEEQKPKTVPVPFQSSLYDTWSPGDNFLVFSSPAKTTYEIQNVDEWLKSESNNGRNFKHEEKINVTLKYDFFSYSSNFIGSSDPPPFKIVNDFYSWIKSENNYEIYLLNVYGDNGDKLFKFSTFNWDFITNPNCYVYIYIYTFGRKQDDISTNRYVKSLTIETFPSSGYEWQINRYDDNGNYNNRKKITFSFNFNNQSTSSNQ